MPKLLIDQLKTNTRARVKIAGPGVLVEGYITDEINLGGTAEHNNPLYSAAQESFSTAYQRLIAGIGAASSKAQSYVPNVSPVALQQSVASWTGTTKPVFNIKLVFVALKETDDVRTRVSQLYKTVFPTTVTVGEAKFLKAPLGYAPSGLYARGTLTIEVGQWFRATGQIMKNVDFSFSKQTIASGAPLYASGSVSFEPFRNVDYADILGYLRLA